MRKAGLLGLAILAVLAVVGEAATWWGKSERDTTCTGVELFSLVLYTIQEEKKRKKEKKDPFQECLFFCGSVRRSTRPLLHQWNTQARRVLLNPDDRRVCVRARVCTLHEGSRLTFSWTTSAPKSRASRVPFRQHFFPPDLHIRIFLIIFPPLSSIHRDCVGHQVKREGKTTTPFSYTSHIPTATTTTWIIPRALCCSLHTLPRRRVIDVFL